jgi:hypothetical protein
MNRRRKRYGTYKSANEESSSGLVVVLAGGDDVELLSSAAVARSEVHWDKVLAEVAGVGGHGKALPVGSLDGGVREGTGGSRVPDLRLSDGCSVERNTGGRSSDRGGGNRGGSSLRGRGSLGGRSRRRGSRGAAAVANGEELIKREVQKVV